ncbi:MAG: acetolactate synthase large subunit, partial [Propionibacteriaceae bacterium]|nr:acetolactate synthase large subunit [Propionibacteriaceae bacterium]
MEGQMMTGAQALIASLEQAGVEVLFGIPGGQILPSFDPMYDSKIRQILVRHEQGAGHAAEGYAIATGKVGVCIATSGPGATNLVTPILDAYMDSVPIVAITGQVAGPSIGTDAFQEADIRNITTPITKHNFLVTRTEDIPRAIKEAFHIASTGRPGPVLVDITKDAQNGTAPFVWPKTINLPGYKPTTKPHVRQVQQAAEMIAAANRPVLYIGGGVARAGAAEQLTKFAHMTGIPVTTTLMARDVFSSDDPLSLGMPGMHGTVAAVGALQKADLLIAIGTRFDDRVTGKLSAFAPLAKVIHADIDPAEIGKNRAADLPIVGDAKAVLTELVSLFETMEHPDWQPWRDYLDGLKARYPLGWETPTDGKLSPQAVIKRIGELVGPEAIYVTGVGQHQMWSAQFLPHERPGSWLTSGGSGTMGYCIPAAMGAQVGQPGKVVFGIDGDGCFQMTNQEITTCSLNGIPIKIAIIANNTLGMVRQWQTLFYGKRYSNTDLHTDDIPDFVKMSEAMGAAAFRVTTEDEIDETIAKAMAINDRPVVIEFKCATDALVLPMVPAGASNDEILIAPGVGPDWQE